MSSERTYCQRCGRFAPTGHIFCSLCDAVLETVKRLEKENEQCHERLKEFVGPDGGSWKIRIKEQSHTIGSFAKAKEKVEALLAMGFWYLELTEVK